MFPLELNGPELDAYRAALTSSHRTRVEVDILDTDEEPVGSLSAEHGLVVSGQVDVDTTSDVSRRLTLAVHDPRNRLQFDPDSPSKAAVFAHRMLAVRRGIYVSEIQQWVDVPLFWGPITHYERRGPTVTLQAAGKETLYQEPYSMQRARSWKRGAKVTGVMRELMEDMGETRFLFPESDRKLPHELSLVRTDDVWAVLRRLAASLNRHLFFDGEGRARLRSFPKNAAVVFGDGHNALLVGDAPQVSYSGDFFNCVLVLGPKPEGKKVERIRAFWVAPPGHPLSPGALARNDHPVFRMQRLDVDAPSDPGKDASEKEKERFHEHMVAALHHAQEIAERRGLQGLRLAMEVSFEALPVYELEELDPIAVVHDGGRWESQAQRFTLPLDSGSAMSVGFNKQVPQANRRRKRGGP